MISKHTLSAEQKGARSKARRRASPAAREWEARARRASRSPSAVERQLDWARQGLGGLEQAGGTHRSTSRARAPWAGRRSERAHEREQVGARRWRRRAGRTFRTLANRVRRSAGRGSSGQGLRESHRGQRRRASGTRLGCAGQRLVGSTGDRSRVRWRAPQRSGRPKRPTPPSENPSQKLTQAHSRRALRAGPGHT